MNLKITVRLYIPEDLDTITQIFLDAVQVTACKDYDKSQIAAWAQIDTSRWEARCSNRPVWIAMVNGQPAGFTDLEDNGHLDMMFVDPRFARLGVATALLETVEETAASMSLVKIFTEASITAKPFFEKHGFILMAEQLVNIRGAELKNYKMEKLIPGTSQHLPAPRVLLR